MITLVITSCNRLHLLTPTIKSFLKYNTYPIHEIIIIDDSGISGCIDDIKKIIPSQLKTTLLYNSTNIGQINSIDIAYSHVTTDYIFHCEDDWEFTKSGFIEISLEILNKYKNIYTVWLREYRNSRVVLCGHPILPKIYDDSFRILGSFKERTNTWYGFTFNPGLRRTIDYKKFMPYSKYINSSMSNCGGVEQALSHVYHMNNYVSAITTHEKGYVKHIGWNDSTQKLNIP
jgi:GT2 family glycosyltransferase